MQEKEIPQETVAKSQKFKNMLCYVPFGSVILFFIEKDKTPEFMQHIKYWAVLLVLYVLLNAFLGWMWLAWLVFLAYAWISWFLWWKAYSGEDVKINIIDDLEKKYLTKNKD